MREDAVIAKGKLNITEESFQVRFLAMTDLEGIEQLQRDVKALLEQTEQLQPLTTDEFKYILSGNGFMIGTYVKHSLIAFRAMMVPSDDNPEHLGMEIGLNEKDLPKMIHSEISVVHPDYRGNGLQQYMGHLVMANVDRERFRYVAATVAPFNFPSLKDKLAIGMDIVDLIETYNGKMRYVLFRDLLSDNNPAPAAVTTIDMGEIEVQKQLLEDGYYGVSVQVDAGTYKVTYQRTANTKFDEGW